MLTLEQLLPKTSVRGIVPDTLVTVVNVQGFGDGPLELYEAMLPRRPLRFFTREPDFGVTSVNRDFADLLTRAQPPR